MKGPAVTDTLKTYDSSVSCWVEIPTEPLRTGASKPMADALFVRFALATSPILRVTNVGVGVLVPLMVMGGPLVCVQAKLGVAPEGTPVTVTANATVLPKPT